jgi:hypothetical protein
MIGLLAERAALCWLHVQAAEAYHFQISRNTQADYRDLAYAEKRLTAAQNRFLRAGAALTKARAMIATAELIQERRDKTVKPGLKLAAAG